MIEIVVHIIEGVVAIAVTGTVGALWYADRAHKREEETERALTPKPPNPQPTPADEERRILERQREEALNARDNADEDGNGELTERWDKRLDEIDERLIQIARKA